MLGFYRKPRHEVETACRGCLSRRLAGLALVGLVGLLPSAASGEVLLFAANAGEQTFTGTDARLADLNGSAAGGTSLSFTTSQANQRVAIIFDATCFLDGIEETWAVITVLVDPAGSGPEFRAPPTNNSANGGALFCYENADLPLDDGVSRASVVATARPAVAGTHTVKVQVAVASRSLTTGSPDPQAQAVLQATSLTVMR